VRRQRKRPAGPFPLLADYLDEAISPFDISWAES
jgi:hypothetical protein